MPMFAKRIGRDCSYCHVAFPKLNETGRIFKTNGYRFAEEEEWEEVAEGEEEEEVDELADDELEDDEEEYEEDELDEYEDDEYEEDDIEKKEDDAEAA